MLDILFISPYYPPYIYGGAEVSTSILIHHLAKKVKRKVITSALTDKAWTHDGVQVIPLFKVIGLGNRTFNDLISYGMKVLFFPWLNGWLLFRYLQKHRPELIHLVPNGYHFIGQLLVIKLLKIPVMIDIRDFTWVCLSDFSFKFDAKQTFTKHNCFNHLSSSYTSSNVLLQPFLSIIAIYETLVFTLYMGLIKILVNNSKLIQLTAISQYTKDRLSEAGFKADNINVISNIMSPQKQSQVPRKKEFVFAGRVEKSKGVWELIKAFQLADISDFSLSIYGDGTELPAIKKYVAEHKISSVNLKGRQSPDFIMSAYHSCFAIIATPYRPEPLGRYILDSFRSLTPLITTNNGGQIEFITHEKNGVLVSPQNVSELSNAMRKLAHDKKLYTKICNKLKKLPESLKIDSIVKKRLSIYLTLTAQ